MMTTLSEPDKESGTVMEEPKLITSAVKKGLQMADDPADHSCEVHHFMNRWVKFQHEMEGIMSAYKAIYRSTQKAAQSKIIYFFAEPSVLPVMRRFITVATFIQENQPPLFQ